MYIKDIVDEDFQDYKKPSMMVAFPICDFKCCREAGMDEGLCQNSAIAKQPSVDIPAAKIAQRYIKNSITEAIIFAGLEPMVTFTDVISLVEELRRVTDDDIVIYTGYDRDEIQLYVNRLKSYKNIIIKYGRFIPNQPHHYDSVLGIELASPNQYAERLSL